MYEDSMGSPQQPRPTPASLLVTSVQIIAPVQSPVERFVHISTVGRIQNEQMCIKCI